MNEDQIQRSCASRSAGTPANPDRPPVIRNLHSSAGTAEMLDDEHLDYLCEALLKDLSKEELPIGRRVRSDHDEASADGPAEVGLAKARRGRR